MFFGANAEKDEKIQAVEDRFEKKLADLSASFDRRLLELKKEVELIKENPPDTATSPNADPKDQRGTIGGIGVGDEDMSKHVAQVSMNYEIAASTWDCSIFLMTSAVQRVDSFLSVLACLVACVVQATFCLLVVRSMVDFDGFAGDSKDDYLNWRLFTGHSAKYYDDFEQSSLVERVCQGSQRLSVSAKQQGTFEDLDGYLSNELHLTATDGRVLCLLVLLLWILAIIQELNTIRLFTAALWSKTGSGPTRFTKNADGGFDLANMNRGRALVVTLLAVTPRVGVAIFLGYSGTVFLAFTQTMEDLLLNALALQFVLDIDDILYGAIVPRRVKDMQEHLAPVELKAVSQSMLYKFGFDLRVVATIMAILTYILCLDFLVVKPFETDMQKVKTDLCDGNQAWVWAKDPSTGVIYISDTQMGGALADFHTREVSYHSNALKQKASDDQTTFTSSNWDNGALTANTYKMEASVDTVIALLSYSDQEAADLAACSNTNFTKDNEFVKLKAMEWYLQQTFSQCADIRQNCTGTMQAVVRNFCPGECGCDDIWGPYDLTGCSSQCQSNRQVSLRTFARQLNCQDMSVAEISGNHSDTWRIFWTGYGNSIENRLSTVYQLLGSSSDDASSKTVSDLVDLAESSGCDLVSDLKTQASGSAPDPCAENLYNNDVRGYCAGTCGVTSCQTSNTAANNPTLLTGPGTGTAPPTPSPGPR